jgi:hypothetical protein
MDKELIESLYTTVLEKRKIRLTELQRTKFMWACEKAIVENPTLNFHDWTIAAQIYLNFVLNFPDVDLGPIVGPLDD